MSDIDILKEMIKESATVPTSAEYQKKKVTLTESESPESSVTITGLPESVLVIKGDKFRSPDTVFKGSRGECKRADFVILAHDGVRKVMLYIEMKATKGREVDIIQQLTGARCFVTYCREVGKSFWRQESFLQGYEERFISIAHTRICKRETRFDRARGVHDRPEKMMKIAWAGRLQFTHLAGRG